MFKQLIAVTFIAIAAAAAADDKAPADKKEEQSFHQLVQDLPSIHFVQPAQNNPNYDLLVSTPSKWTGHQRFDVGSIYLSTRDLVQG